MTLERDTLLNNRYRIIDVLGHGGMGSVYRAIDENLGLEVAVKENAYTTKEYSRQFRREAVILASMRHPNLPRVSDHFEIAGQGQYLVMDYIEGEDLRQRMDRVSLLKEEEALIMGAAICDALHYLHTRQPPVLHRDIKPGNIKISPDGSVYLVDFGLAKIVEGGKATTTGARAMTPGYSSPEQYGTARTDERSDVYSVGATLYAALTNTIPEDGLARAMEQADLTPLRKRNSKVSRRLAQVIEKALEIHPEDRYQTADEFKRDLLQAGTGTRALQQAGEMTVPPPPPDVIAEVAKGLRANSIGASEPEISGESQTRIRRRNRKRISRLMYFFVAILFGISLGWYDLGMPGGEYISGIFPDNEALSGVLSAIFPPTETPTPDSNVVLPSTPESTSSGIVTQEPTTAFTEIPTDSPEPAKTDLVSEDTPTATVIATATLTPVPFYNDQQEPSSHEAIAFASIRSGTVQIWLYSFADRTQVQLTDVEGGACQPTWSPDGSQLVYTSPCRSDALLYIDSYLYLFDLASGESAILPMTVGSFDPAWSPDGHSLLYTRMDSEQLSSIYRYDFDDGSISLMTQGKLNYQPEWSPDGDQIVFVSTRQNSLNLFVMPNDPIGEVTLFTRSGDNHNYKPSWSRQGEVVFSQGTPGNFVTLVHASDSIIGVAPGAYMEYRVNASSEVVPEADPDFSSSGTWIAYESWPTGDNHDIFVMRIDGTKIFRLTTGRSLDFDPAWRPLQ